MRNANRAASGTNQVKVARQFTGMVFKFVSETAKTWRRLKGENQLPKVVRGIKFQNGVKVIEMSAHNAA